MHMTAKEHFRLGFYLTLAMFLVIGILGGHFYYAIDAQQEVERVRETLPTWLGRDISVNYFNIPHAEHILYGLLAGAVLGITLGLGMGSWLRSAHVARNKRLKHEQRMADRIIVDPEFLVPSEDIDWPEPTEDTGPAFELDESTDSKPAG